MTTPPIILGIPSVGPADHSPSGPLSTTHTATSSLHTTGVPTLSTMVHTIPSFIQGGIFPSTMILAIQTIPVNTYTVGSQPYQTPFAHGN